MNFKEKIQFYLQESGPDKIIYHYTRFDSLLDILKSNALLFTKYDTSLSNGFDNSSNKKDKDSLSNKFEFCTTRNGKITKPIDLSYGAGNIKVIINFHILNDKVRNLKVKPINEFPIIFKKQLIKNLGEQNFKILEQELKNFKIKTLKFNKTIFDINSKIENQYIERLIEMMTKNNQKFDDYQKEAKNRLEEFAEYFYYLRNREQEERIILNKNIKDNPEDKDENGEYYIRPEKLINIDLNKLGKENAIKIDVSKASELEKQELINDYLDKFPDLFIGLKI